MMPGLRTALGSLCLLLSAMSVALLPLIFSSSWYRFNCHFHEFSTFASNSYCTRFVIVL